jgi:thiamine phosphate synthase YjbQ (UPF0047 family)
MRVTTSEEAIAVHDLYRVIAEMVSDSPLDNQMVVSVLLKITASIALAEEWDRDELLQAFAVTYDMEKFLNPTSKERH